MARSQNPRGRSRRAQPRVEPASAIREFFAALQKLGAREPERPALRGTRPEPRK